MRKSIPVLIAALTLLGMPPQAFAQEEGLPQRGKTYTTDGNVSRYRPRSERSEIQIFILRGTQAKENQKDSGIVVQAPTEEAKKEPPKAKRGFRKRGTVYTE